MAMQQSEVSHQRTDDHAMTQQEARATDSPQQTGTIGSIGTVGGSQNPVVVGSSDVTFNNSYYLLEGRGVPGPLLQHCQRADQDPSSGASSYQDAGKRTRDILMKWYKTTQSYVQLNPGVPDDQRPIAGIYTKVQIRTKKGTAEEKFTDEIAYSTEYEKIFKQLDTFDRLILFGKGGVGKSTIFDKIAYDWADEASQMLKRFKLVLLLKMCALVQETDLVDVTFDQLLGKDSGIAKDDLNQFILTNPNEILILLDGFDEMRTNMLNAQSFGSVLNAVNRTRYRDCVIFVSTRPSHMKTLMSSTLVRNPCTHVEVLGFNDKEVSEYVGKFYDKDPESGNELVQTITESYTLCDFARNPMMLLLMCLLWEENKQLPQTMSRLFTKAVHFMFTRKDKTTNRPSDAKEREILETVIAIGKTALHGLMGANETFAFQEVEFEPKALSSALKAGILTKQRVIKSHKSHSNIQFMHKTMQEYCAAKYLQRLHEQLSNRGNLKHTVPLEDFHKCLRQLCDTLGDVYSHEFLLRLCCGENEKCMTDIVELLDSKQSEIQNGYKSHLQAIIRNCFFESQAAKLPECLTNDAGFPSEIKVRDDEDFRCLLYLLEITCKLDSRTIQLARVRIVSLFRVSSVRGLDFALGYMENLRQLSISTDSLNGDDLGELLSSVCSKHLISLSIEDCHALGGRAAEWAPHMKHVTNLNELGIENCDLEEKDIPHIVEVIGTYLLKCTHLKLSDNGRAMGGSANMWAKDLRKLTHLKELHIDNCDLTPTDIEHIASVVCDMPSLTELSLSQNHTLSGQSNLWTKHLHKMTHIERLDLSGSSYTMSDLEHIFLGVCDMPCLTDLCLDGNLKQEEDRVDLAKLWTRDLPKMKNLKRLFLRYCKLKQVDVEHIITSVVDMPRLAHLDLMGNEELSESALLLANTMPRLTFRAGSFKTLLQASLASIKVGQ